MPMPGAAPWDMKMCRKPPACACGAASGNPADCATGPFSGQALEAACRAHGLALVYLLAPTSTPERIALVAGRSTGFTYLVSQTGVTGARDQLPADLAAFVGRVRTVARTPLAVGFGISNAAQARAVGRIADGVIVGSALINTVAEAADGPAAAASFVAGLRTALERRAE
jgi:tryptophan synthase alpha chain